MALLQRTRLLSNERLDLTDYNRIEDFVCADFRAIHEKTLSNANFVLQGFVATGIGTTTLSVTLANSSALFGADNGALFIGAASLAALSTSSLAPSTTNYIEVFVDQDTGGADSRAFWDKTANAGAGAEFSQIVDTFTFLKANLSISTSNFSGDSNKAKICEVDTNGSGVITAIRDRRDMFYRLGRGTNTTFAFPWSSRTEPLNTQFTGADKDLKSQKDSNDAMQSSIREIQGTTYWFEQSLLNLKGIFQNTGLSILTAATASARFTWSGTQLLITDDNGSPSDSDVLAYLRLFSSTSVLGLTRQDGGAAITLADDQVVWIQIPDPLTNVSYDSVGGTSTNYRVSNRGSVPLDDDTFWLAYRDGSRLYVRDLGELKAGESREITDETTIALATFLGFDPETATSVPYTATPNGDFPATFTTANTLVDAISVLAQDLNYLEGILNHNAYDEALVVVSGAPADDNEVTGPVSSGTVLTLPFDSRNGNAIETYIVGQGFIEVYLNGVFLFDGVEYVEVGTTGSISTSFQILLDLVVGDQLTIRIDTTGGIVSSGGSGTLQDAYNIGNSITTTSGRPFTVGGAGTKVAQFNGDIGVTGIIDPLGVEFDRIGSDPLGAKDGFWVNSSGELMYKQQGVGTTNISTAVGGGGSSVSNQDTIANHSGSTILSGTPISVDTNGYAVPVDVSTEANALAAFAITSANIADTASGTYISSGTYPNILGFSFRDVLFVSKTGTLTNVKPAIGVGGFLAGDFVIRVGVVKRNVTTPSQMDLSVNVQVVGQL